MQGSLLLGLLWFRKSREACRSEPLLKLAQHDVGRLLLLNQNTAKLLTQIRRESFPWQTLSVLSVLLADRDTPVKCADSCYPRCRHQETEGRAAINPVVGFLFCLFLVH